MSTDLSTSARQDEAESRTSDSFVLPAKIVWLWGIGPLLLAPMVVPRFLLLPIRLELSIIASFYLAFFGIGGALYYAYQKLQPRFLRRPAPLGTLLLLHALFTAGLVIPTALSIQPLYCLVQAAIPTSAEVRYCLYGITPVQRMEFLWTSLVVSWGAVLPALMMHTQRKEKQAIERRLQDEQRARLLAQLQTLQSRLQPHFLFNSLNTIACLISEDPNAAERVVERLAELLRYSLQEVDRMVVPLPDELAVVGAYLSVQSARFGSRLRHEIDCPAALSAYRIPPLSVLPLVENAVLHGAVAQRGGGAVTVRAEIGEKQLLLSVQDDGPGAGLSAHHGNGLALRELNERLRILYPDADPPAQVTLTSSPTRPGCLAQLCLPLDPGPKSLPQSGNR